MIARRLLSIQQNNNLLSYLYIIFYQNYPFSPPYTFSFQKGWGEKIGFVGFGGGGASFIEVV